jgi:hypothetical protein
VCSRNGSYNCKIQTSNGTVIALFTKQRVDGFLLGRGFSSPSRFVFPTKLASQSAHNTIRQSILLAIRSTTEIVPPHRRTFGHGRLKVILVGPWTAEAWTNGK